MRKAGTAGSGSSGCQRSACALLSPPARPRPAAHDVQNGDMVTSELFVSLV